MGEESEEAPAEALTEPRLFTFADVAKYLSVYVK